MRLLHLDSSILGANSVSRQLTSALVRQLEHDNPGLQVNYRDLTAEPLSHLSEEVLQAQSKSPENRTASEQKEVEAGARAMEDFLNADVIVIGAPMYNFSISSQLKAWIDRIAVAGKTFRYTENGPVGLAGGKLVYVVTARGGFYGADTPLAALDHQESYLRTVFNFLGIADIEYIRAEGVAISPEHRRRAIEAAQAQVHAHRQHALVA